MVVSNQFSCSYEMTEVAQITYRPLVLTRPDQSQGSWEDSRSNDDAHHKVQVSHGYSGVVETNREGSDKHGVAHNE